MSLLVHWCNNACLAGPRPHNQDKIAELKRDGTLEALKWGLLIAFVHWLCEISFWLIYKTCCPKQWPNLKLQSVKCRGRSLSREQKPASQIARPLPGSPLIQKPRSPLNGPLVSAVINLNSNLRNTDCWLTIWLLIKHVTMINIPLWNRFQYSTQLDFCWNRNQKFLKNDEIPIPIPVPES